MHFPLRDGSGNGARSNLGREEKQFKLRCPHLLSCSVLVLATSSLPLGQCGPSRWSSLAVGLTVSLCFLETLDDSPSPGLQGGRFRTAQVPWAPKCDPGLHVPTLTPPRHPHAKRHIQGAAFLDALAPEPLFGVAPQPLKPRFC